MNNRSWYLLSKKLSFSATDAELDELEQLLREQPEWHYSVEQVGRIWEVSAGDKQDEADFLQHISRMEKKGIDTAIFTETAPLIKHPRSKPAKKLLVAVMLAATAVLAISCWFLFRSHTPLVANASETSNKKVVVTKTGDRRKMLLPDGTQVWLNAESKLEFNEGYGKTNRSVTLSGEAYFDVVKNVDLPFTIETNKIHIKVTGTAFNVKAYPGEKVSETSLIRGRVEVTVNARPDEKYILKPNEKLVIRDEEEVKTSAASADKRTTQEPLIQLGYVNFLGTDSAAVETSWVYDRLVFDEETMANIAQKLNRWYGVNIDITDPLLADQKLTYTIRKETITQALNNMQYALRFHYTVNGNYITITR